MLNWLAKILLTATAVAPVLLVFAIHYLSQQNHAVSLVLVGAVIVLVALLWILLRSCDRTIERMQLSIVSIESADREYVTFVLLYLSPLFFTDMGNVNWLIMVPSLALFFVLIATGYGYHFNPLMGLLGYHFYKVGTDEGVKYVLVTKKKLRSAKKVFTVGLLTDYIVLDYSKDRDL